MRARLPVLLFAVAACGEPLAPAGGPEAVCEAVGDTVENGDPTMHFVQRQAIDGRVLSEERWVDGAASVASSVFLYADGRLVHERDDTDGDGRIERVVDWVRDADGRVLAVDEVDRVSDRHHHLAQTWEADEVVRRTQSVDGVLLSDEQTGLDPWGRPVEQRTYDLAGQLQSRWEATYLEPAPSRRRQRVGWVGDVLETDALEDFDAEGRLVLQEGLAEGYVRTWSMAYEGDRPVREVFAFGSLEQTRTWAYDAEGRLLEDRSVLVGGGAVVEEVVTTWVRDCPDGG